MMLFSLLQAFRCSVRSLEQRVCLSGQVCPPVSLFYNDIYEVPLPEGHRFPMAKYRMVRQLLMKEYDDPSLVTFTPSPMATSKELASTHCPQYIQRFINGQMNANEIRRTGFPWSPEHVRRSTSSVGGTTAATRAVLAHPSALLAGHIAGGTHHAFYDYGEGFCVFSDIAVAANLALQEHPFVEKIAIIDLDVHQGNGNAVLFEQNPNVITFSMHCKENVFSALQVSTVDVELAAGCGDDEYLSKLSAWMPYLVDIVKPNLVFFQAGVDVFVGDKLGKLALSRQGIRRRNRMVIGHLLKNNIKTVITMGGGYPRDLNPASQAFQELVECHADVYRDCIDGYREHVHYAQRCND